MSDFDARAADWDTPERQERARTLAGVIRAAVPLDATMAVIDIGAGTGLLGLELARDVGTVLLAEASEGMLAVAQEKLASGRPPNVSAVRFDLMSDAQPGGPFDLAVSLLVLHHVADTFAALRRIHALLRPGAWIALADLDAEDGTFHDAGAVGIHHLGFDRTAITGLAQTAGFRDLSTRTATRIEQEGRAYPLFLLTGRRV